MSLLSFSFILLSLCLSFAHFLAIRSVFQHHFFLLSSSFSHSLYLPLPLFPQSHYQYPTLSFSLSRFIILPLPLSPSPSPSLPLYLVSPYFYFPVFMLKFNIYTFSNSHRDAILVSTIPVFPRLPPKLVILASLQNQHN